ncbi:hypothetical protein [Streptomyces sp. HC307]|uniref:hypothetical protein n=1 Tax=Streptomyces flavusporus TaxID=3385496 RepID=UPI003916E77A
MLEGQDEDSCTDLPIWATRHPRWGLVHGRHHIPTIGTIITAPTLAEARTLISFCLTDARS